MNKRLAAAVSVSLLASSALARADDTQACTQASSQGQELRDAHKLIEARDAFMSCARQECPAVVRKYCTAWTEEAQASVPTIVPMATDDQGDGIPGVRVLVDGKVLVEKAEGRAIEIDPGTYTFTFQAPDGTKVEKATIVAEGEKDKRVVAVVARREVARAEPSLPSPAPAATPVAAPTNAIAPKAMEPSPSPLDSREETPRASSGPWKGIGITATVLGLAGLGAGAFFGLQAAVKKGSAGCDSNSACPTTDAENTLRTARDQGNLATVFFIAGGALTAAGILTWALSANTNTQVAAIAGPGGASFVLRGSL
jgi:hypothetical protein